MLDCMQRKSKNDNLAKYKDWPLEKQSAQGIHINVFRVYELKYMCWKEVYKSNFDNMDR